MKRLRIVSGGTNKEPGSAVPFSSARHSRVFHSATSLFWFTVPIFRTLFLTIAGSKQHAQKKLLSKAQIVKNKPESSQYKSIHFLQQASLIRAAQTSSGIPRRSRPAEKYNPSNMTWVFPRVFSWWAMPGTPA